MLLSGALWKNGQGGCLDGGSTRPQLATGKLEEKVQTQDDIVGKCGQSGDGCETCLQVCANVPQINASIPLIQAFLVDLPLFWAHDNTLYMTKKRGRQAWLADRFPKL